MAGLLDTFFGSPAQTQALGLLGASMASGKGFGQGALLAQQHLAGEDERKLKQQMLQAQIAESQAQAQERQAKAGELRRQQEFLQNLPGPTFLAGQQGLLGGSGPTNANAANVAPVNPQHQFMHQAVKAGALPVKDYLSAFSPKEEEFSPTPQVMRDPQGNLVNVLISKSGKTKVVPYGVKPDMHIQDTGGGFQAVDKNALQPGQTIPRTGNPFSDLVLGDGNGGYRPNAPLVNVKGQLAAQGATRVQMPAINLSDPTAVARAGMDLQDKVRGALKGDNVIANQYKAMLEAAKTPSAQGDTAMLYSFFKVLDPESTVREGEIDMVKSSRSIPDRFKGMAQKLANGQFLMPNERQDILTQAQRQVQARMPRSSQDVQAYRENAKRLALDPNLYVPDPYDGIKFGDASAPTNPIAAAAAAELARRRTGK